MRSDLGVDSILDFIGKGRLRWYGHVKRMEEDRFARKFLEWIPEGTRPVGRPRKRWIKGVAEAVEERGETLGNVENSRLYADRSAWKRFVRSGGPIV